MSEYFEYLIRSKRYRERSTECEELSLAAGTPQMREYYRKMAEHYRRLALSIEGLVDFSVHQRPSQHSDTSS